jgi:ABC-type Fe3+-siderophore transport system permease subunit
MTARADKFRQAAIAYIGLGATVIILTLVAGSSPQRGMPPLTLLLVGVVFVAIFGVLLYAYAWMTRRWLQRIIAVLAGILVVTNALRALQYFMNFLGYRLELNFRTFSLAIHPSEFHFPVLFLICALLMAGITYMLARAAWDL